jgi:hypothetical protein
MPGLSLNWGEIPFLTREASPDQRGTLAQIARDNRHLYRGYLMKEQLRQILAPDTVSGRALLAGLISWPEFGHFLSA